MKKYKILKVDQETHALIKAVAGEIDMPEKDIVSLGVLLVYYFLMGDADSMKKTLEIIKKQVNEQKKKRSQLLNIIDSIKS